MVGAFSYGYGPELMIRIDGDPEEALSSFLQFLNETGLRCKRDINTVLLGTQRAISDSKAVFNYYQWNGFTVNTEEGIRACEELGKILGFKTVCQLSPEKHDEMIGFLSQLTHCIAVSLMTCKDSTELVNYTGDSFRDLTRIAKINETMWTELFLLNKEELLSQMDLFSTKFKELRDSIENEDTEKIKEIMKTSTMRRAYFDKK
jgi:hypothetical protein